MNYTRITAFVAIFALAALIAVAAAPAAEEDSVSFDAAVGAVADSAKTDVAEYIVTFGMEHGDVTAYVDGKPIKSGAAVPDGTEVTFSATPAINYDIVSWRIGSQKEITFSDTMKLTVDGGNLSVLVQTIYVMNPMNNNQFIGELPTDVNYAPAWNASPNGGVHGFSNMLYHPAVMGDFAYARNDGNIVMIDLDDGSLVKVVSAGKPTMFYQWVTAGNNQIADGCTSTIYDANLNPLFKLDKANFKVYYSQGYYIVCDKAGTLYGYSAVDEDPSVPDNVQAPVWTAATSTFGGWSGPSQIMFGDGFLLTATSIKDPENRRSPFVGLATVDLSTGAIVDTLNIAQFKGAKINTGYLDMKDGIVTFTVYNAGIFDSGDETMPFNIAAVNVNSDGSFVDDSLKVASTGGSSHLSSMIIVDGLGFVVGNSVAKVYNLDTLECIATSPESKYLAGHGSMVLTIDGNKIRGYNTPYSGCPHVGGFEYDVENNTIFPFVLADVNKSQYGSGSPVITEDGILLHRNDSGYIAGISFGNSVTVNFDDDTQVVVKVTTGAYVDLSALAAELFTDEAMTQKWNADAPVTSDITLYAKAMYSVFVDADNSDVTILVDGAEVENGSSVSAGAEVEIFVKPAINYDIQGWEINDEYVDGYASYRLFTVESDIVVTVDVIYMMNSMNNNQFMGELPSADDFEALKVISPEGGVQGFKNMIYHAVVMDGYAYARNDANILKINVDRGEIVKTVVNEKHTSFYEWLTVGAGLVADGASGVVYNYNLSPQFVLEKSSSKLYYGAGMFLALNGNVLYAYSALDADPEVPDNVQSAVWSCPLVTFTGFGGTGNIVYSDGYFVTTTTAGDARGLISIDAQTGKVAGTIDIPQFKGASLNTNYLDFKNGMVTLTVYGSGIFDSGDETLPYNIAVVKLKEDGSFNADSLKVASTGGSSHLSSLIIVDRLGFVMGNRVVKVYNLDTLECIATSEENALIAGHGSMVVGYVDGKVRGCLVPYGSNDGVAGFEFDIESKAIRTYVMPGIINAQYGSGAPVVTEDGKVITRNDSGLLGIMGISYEVKVVYSDGTEETKVMGNGDRFSISKKNIFGYYIDEAMTVEWDPSTPILSDLTVYVKLSAKYVINVDGVTTETEIALGDKPALPEEVPEKVPSVDKVYTFSKWELVTDENGNITATAVFTESPRTYTVSYVTDTGIVVSQKEVAYGGAPDLQVVGTKPSDTLYDYTFVKWVNMDGSEVNLKTVTEDISLMGVYTASERDYSSVVPVEVTVGIIAATVIGGLAAAFFVGRKN